MSASRDKAQGEVRIRLPLEEMHRGVTRTGTRVEFCNAAMGFVGSTYVYEFPDEATAAESARLLETRDKDGVPWGVAEAWREYWVK